MAHHLGKADWSDNERVQRMARTYSMRYDEKFWNAFRTLTGIKPRTVVADFGCGPGLLLVDVAKHLKAHTAIAIDESEQMLSLAETNLREKTNLDSIIIQQVNLDTGKVQVASLSIDLAFSGFMLHEVANPRDFVSDVFRLIKLGGIYVVYDYVSGNEEAFVEAMLERGMDEDHARKRYPHMCRHSIEEIIGLMETAGLSKMKAIGINDIRATVIGMK